jgi:excisionase family DNA binding protein
VETILQKLAEWPTRYMTMDEAADLLAMHVQTLYRAARNNRFPAVRVFGSLRIDPASLASWLSKRGA